MTKYRILNSDYFDADEEYTTLIAVGEEIQAAVNAGNITASEAEDVEIFVVRRANVSIDIEVTVTVSDLGGNN
jgi:hypothetical protein